MFIVFAREEDENDINIIWEQAYGPFPTEGQARTWLDNDGPAATAGWSEYAEYTIHEVAPALTEKEVLVETWQASLFVNPTALRKVSS